MRLWTAGCILALTAQDSFRGAASPSAVSDSTRSTRDGAYTAEQAIRGKELYAMHCVSCHSAVSHAGVAFVDKWDGRLLWELYRFVSEFMPKSEPGSLSPGEYSRVLAYLLQMNGVPAGPDELTPDSTALQQIRLDLKPR